MTVSVQFEPEFEERLLAQARAQGVTLEVYLQELVEQVRLHSQAVIERLAVVETRSAVSLEEFDSGLDALAEGAERIPVLPADAYRREAIYGDA